MHARSVHALLWATLLPLAGGCAKGEDPGFGALPAAADAAIEATSDETAIDDTAVLETGTTDTGTPDGDTAETPSDLPSVDVTAPVAPASIGFDSMSTACQSQRFTVPFTAPAGLETLRWTFVAPDASKASTPMVGDTCSGAVVYDYFLDPTPFKGKTAGTVQEDVAIAGSYVQTSDAGTTSGPWWWCTAPGISSTSTVFSPPLPGSPGVKPLSAYCAITTTPPSGDPASRWHLHVTVVDALGRSAFADYQFWVHQ
jgi:hypothetical protein